jgi:hypothetical protein
VGITTSTKFAKPKLEQKHNSLHEKNSKVPNYITIISTTRIKKKKTPLSFLREDFKSIKKQWGSLKKMKIRINLPKLQVIQPNLTSRI